MFWQVVIMMRPATGAPPPAAAGGHDEIEILLVGTTPPPLPHRATLAETWREPPFVRALAAPPAEVCAYDCRAQPRNLIVAAARYS